MENLKNCFLAFMVSLTLLIACKKDPKPGAPSKNGSRDELTKDSIFLYAKETYLWNDALPSYGNFNPRGFANFDAEVDALGNYKINPATGKPYDKYSFIDDGTISDELNGVSGDFGFGVFYNSGSSTDLRINYVYAGSPAAVKGLKRGDQIVKLNGRTDLDNQSNGTINFVVDAIYGSKETVNLTVKKADGSTADVSINRATYSIDPILYRNVYTAGTKKVGYFVFNSFLRISSDNNAPTALKAKLDELFAYFQSQGVTEVIVDLRYNGGGSVETADYIVNYLAPTSTNGVMHVDHYNQLMQQHKATILKNQKFKYNGQTYSFFDFDFSTQGSTSNFEKKGSLNLSRIYFIVTRSTASASELVINCLKPVIDVKLIGNTTYGKPVGFFALHIDKYDLYIPQFQTKNRNGEGDYFTGMSVDKSDYDDVSKDFGDPAERYLAYALNYAEKGNFILTASQSARISGLAMPSKRMSIEEDRRVIRELERTKFKGMIKTRKPENK